MTKWNDGSPGCKIRLHVCHKGWGSKNSVNKGVIEIAM